jgi:magnesium transporter
MMKEKTLDEVLSEMRLALENNDLLEAFRLIEALRPADQADLMEELELPEQVALLSQLSAGESADVLEQMEDEETAMLAELLPSGQLAGILDEMESDEAADVLGDLTQAKVAETLREMDEPGDVVSLLRYPDDTAGGLMTGAVVTLRQDWTAEQALAELRRAGPEAESTYYLFVLDEADRLLGVIGLRDLVTMPVDGLIAERMETDVVSVLVTADQEECARILSHHGFLALPVVDEIGRFLGVITADDLIEVSEYEATEDMYRMAGITGDERIFGSVWASTFKRLPWLVANVLVLLVAITVVDAFEDVIAGLVALAVFLPLVSGVGGNAANQTTTLIVRGIALEEVSPNDLWRALFKELRVALINGTLIGLGNAVVAYIWKQNWKISAGICLAMMLNFLLAATAGVLIPLGLKKMKIDPALASTAFVTGLTDIFGFLFFLGIVSLLV